MRFPGGNINGRDAGGEMAARYIYIKCLVVSMDRYSMIFGCRFRSTEVPYRIGCKPNNLYYAYSDYTIKSCLVTTTLNVMF
jgi:hypothetical protein